MTRGKGASDRCFHERKEMSVAGDNVTIKAQALTRDDIIQIFTSHHQNAIMGPLKCRKVLN